MSAEPQKQRDPDLESVPPRPPADDRGGPLRAPWRTLPTFLARIQLLVVLPAAILLVVSVGAFAYATYLTIHLLFNTSWLAHRVSENVVLALQIVDVCLIGVAGLVIAADVLVIFLSKPRGTPSTPPWLQQESETVDVLKNRALSMVVLILAVTFLERTVHIKPRSGSGALDLGLAIAAFIGALGVYLLAGRLKKG